LIGHPNVEYRPQIDLHDDVVYVGTDRLHALDAATGSERWNRTVDAGPVQSVSVVEEGVEGDHAVFVHADETQLASFDPTGELTWEDSVNEDIWNYLVNELAFVATDAGIYALDY
jgi:outer membrane protein assembly factor BamB